ncbi:bifunctional folylpolyglutamate synthase/dihydrofolate synthase [Schaalia suimastitidis]|uniref:bifunctional folylpolyglutamate synthase/dihydrofolate synthase n=1 Tax=Schaalia suimastitidis TaxID=121163 RepID=UPI000404EA7B|nr:folylpolyglutamate synthase/dihydrofolate synthase family protein [Schaalia suimastitidis]
MADAGSHPAFFGNQPARDAQATQDTDETATPTVPADLLPYLIAADDDDTPAPTSSINSDEEAESLRAAALRALVENSMLLGPDPSLLAELDGELPEGEEWREDIEEDTADRLHVHALNDAATHADLVAKVNDIYRNIVARAPEHKVQPSIARVEAVLDILGDPQHTYPSVHITGTNGKTSTARMVDAILSAAGMKVGRFTSPHLSDVRERISLEGEPISHQAFIAAWEDVAPYISMVDQQSAADPSGAQLSFFEVFAVMALAAFADYPVDAAVIEVGMGGKWDATNVIGADVAVITSISRDHEKWLGRDLESIAQEKAGIIKPGQIVVIEKQDEAVLDILRARAQQVDAIVRYEGVDFEVLDRTIGVGGQMMTLRTPAATYEDVFVPLFGAHQARNAAAAIAAAEAFLGGRKLDGKLLEDAMLSVTSPGRLHVIRSSPTIVVDAAHNPGGAAALADALDESFGFARTVGVFSAMADKDVESILAEVEPHFDHLVVTSMDTDRAMTLDELFAIACDVFGEDRVDARADLVEAIDQAVTVAESTTDPTDSAGIVVFGSVVLAGTVIDLIEARKG